MDLESEAAEAEAEAEEAEEEEEEAPWVEVKLVSVSELRAAYAASRDTSLSDLFRAHSGVGVADASYALIQHQISLYLINIPELSRDFFHGEFLRLFANFPRIRLAEPVAVRSLLRLALDTVPVAMWTAGTASPDFAGLGKTDVTAGDGCVESEAERRRKDAVANEAAERLVAKRTILSRYFAVDIDRMPCEPDEAGGTGLEQKAAGPVDDVFSDGQAELARGEVVLRSLPLVIPQYCPPLARLPLVLLQLALSVDWTREKLCLDAVTRILADFYAVQPDWYLDPPSRPAQDTPPTPAAVARSWPGDDGSGSSSGAPANSPPDAFASTVADPSWMQAVMVALLPAMRSSGYVPSSAALARGLVIQVASLDELYKVFERC